MKIKSLIAALSLVAIFGTSSVAMAKVGDCDNGYWEYGISGGNCYSNYWSWDYDHCSATAVSSKESFKAYGNSNAYAKASVKKTLMGNKAYYNYWN